MRASARRTAVSGLLALAAALAAPAGPLAAQTPEPGDSVAPTAADTAPAGAPDTAAASDTSAAAAAPDTAAAGEAAAGDSVVADSAAAPRAPRLSGEVATGGGAATLRFLLDPSGLGRVAAYRLELSWDPAALELRGVEPGDFGGEFAASTDSAPGKLLAGARRAEGAVDSASALLTASFAAGPALDGGEEADVAVEVAGLRGEGGVALADSLRRRLSPVCLQALPPGDVDGDGTVTSRDAVSVLRRQVGMKVDRAADVSRADLDHDGGADRADAARLLRRQVGLPPASDSAAGEDSADATAAAVSAGGMGKGAAPDSAAGPERPDLGACR